MTKIISYNVNGIRAALKKDFSLWVKAAQPDVLCLQEVKALEEQVDLSSFEKLGYHISWNSAEKKGYSGTATFSKKPPQSVETNFDFEELDREGRFLISHFDTFSVLNLYMPSGASKLGRQEVKLEFLVHFQEKIKSLLEKQPLLIINGDFNIVRLDIDIHNPRMNIRTPGWTPEEREWFQGFLDQTKMVDSFREFNHEPHQYTWWSYMARARAKNLGWRIDYQLVSEALQPKLNRAVILSSAKHSDHCPICVDLDL